MIGWTDAALIAWRAARHRTATREEVVAFRDDRLRRLIAHVHAAVPYYRALLDRGGVAPDQVRTAADLTRIPVTTRRDRQTAPPASLLAEGTDPRRLVVHRTSGSSGEPLRVQRTWLEERLTSVFRLRAMHDFGLRPRDRRVRFVLPRPRDPRNWEGPQRMIRALGVHRKVPVDRRLPVLEILQRLEAIRPDAISGTPGVLVRLARAMDDARRRTVRPRVVVAGGDVLTPLLHRQIAEGFAARVFDMYGSYELGTIAWECPVAGGLHVADDGVVIEVLNDGRPSRWPTAASSLPPSWSPSSWSNPPRGSASTSWSRNAPTASCSGSCPCGLPRPRASPRSMGPCASAWARASTSRS